MAIIDLTFNEVRLNLMSAFFYETRFEIVALELKVIWSWFSNNSQSCIAFYDSAELNDVT